MVESITAGEFAMAGASGARREVLLVGRGLTKQATRLVRVCEWLTATLPAYVRTGSELSLDNAAVTLRVQVRPPA